MQLSETRTVIIDPGHGGSDPGAVYNGRREKDDVLQLAYDLGNALERRGIRVLYTRVSDIYDTPYEKAAIGNNSDADFFISLHRNAMPVPGTGSGIESLVYEKNSIAGLLGQNIDKALAAVGWTDLGVEERPGLVVLRDTTMPAVLVEAGFIDNERDNAFFDANMAATADAIADGILRTFEELERRREAEMSGPSGAGFGAGELPGFYRVQTGSFRHRDNALLMVKELESQGFPAFMVARDGVFYVYAGAFRDLENATRQEQALRRRGYNTLITQS